MPSVTFAQVSKRFGSTVVVETLDLTVNDGELLVLVGGSGSGKSTILRMLAGLETVTTGSIRIGDRDVTALPPRERDVAMVFQDYALYPHMTVRENLALGLRLRRVARAEIDRRVSWAAGVLGIEPLLSRVPKALSGGQRQRVAIGRAMVREPLVFLFDEPLSNLDAGLRAQMRMEIGALQRRLGTTTVYVTHDQVEAMTLGDRIVVLADGRIQQIGSPIELYRNPVNRFVAGFIGTPPMNFVEGVIEGAGASAGGGACFVAGGVRVRVSEAVARSVAVGATVTLGVRPEDLLLVAPDKGALHADSTDVVQGRVVLVERLGGTSHVHLTVNGGAGMHRLMATVSGEEMSVVGEVVAFRVRGERVRVFGVGGVVVGDQA